MALKDASGLVKKYAMVNVHNYQIVATGDSVNECEKVYLQLLKDNGIAKEEEVVPVDTFTVTGKIRRIAESVVDGNSHYYLLLDESDTIYDVNVNGNLSIVLYSEGDTISMTYTKDTDRCTVVSITEKK